MAAEDTMSSQDEKQNRFPEAAFLTLVKPGLVAEMHILATQERGSSRHILLRESGALPMSGGQLVNCVTLRGSAVGGTMEISNSHLPISPPTPGFGNTKYFGIWSRLPKLLSCVAVLCQLFTMANPEEWFRSFVSSLTVALGRHLATTPKWGRFPLTPS